MGNGVRQKGATGTATKGVRVVGPDETCRAVGVELSMSATMTTESSWTRVGLKSSGSKR